MANDEKKQLHILVVTQYFYPETFRINDMCREWVNRGYKVTVLTGIPNYPMGKFFEGYGYRKKRNEIYEGVEIRRIPLIPRGSSAVGMAANYLSFTLSGLKNKYTKDIDADLVFTFEVSPMTQALIGVKYAKRHKVSSFLYVQDLWPENVITVTGIRNGLVIGMINKMVDKIYRDTDVLFATSPAFVKAITDRKKPVAEKKVHYWPQYAEDFYRPLERAAVPEIPDDGSFKIIFTGNIGTAQGLSILPRTARLLKDINVRFVMVGDGRFLEEFNRQVETLQVKDKFTMIPRRPAEDIPRLMAACDAAFISFNDDELWAKTIPAKLQSYMACGLPVIASATGETNRIIEEAECGVTCKIGDAEALAAGIRSLTTMDTRALGNNSRTYFERHFDKKILMDEMDKWLQTAGSDT